jgi:hypothetical protein
VTWSDDGGASYTASGTFKPDTEYWTKYVYTADESYMFDSGTAKSNITVHNKGTGSVQSVNVTTAERTDDTLTIIVKWPKTAQKELTSLEVVTPPAKAAYRHGEYFSADGMVVRAIYDDGSEDEPFYSYYTENTYIPLTAGQTSVTLSNGAVTTSIPVTVGKAAAPAIEDKNISVPGGVSGLQEAFDAAAYAAGSIPADSGSVTWSAGAKTDEHGMIDAFSIDDSGKVTYALTSNGTAGQTAGIPITLHFVNYEPATFHLVITRSATPVTITGLTAADGTYNGLAHAGYTGTAAVAGYPELDGSLVYAYYIGDSGVKTTPENSGAAFEGAAPRTAGSYTLVVSVPESNLSFTGSLEIPFTIEKATVTVTAKNKSAFVGDPVPALDENGYTVTGLASGEALLTAPSLAYESTPDMSKTGTVAITASGAEAGGNYNEIVYVNGTLTISSRPASGGGVTPPPAPADEVKSGESIPASTISRLVSDGRALTVTAEGGAQAVFDAEALKGIAGQASGAVKVEIRDVTPEYQETHKGKSVFSLAVSSGSSSVSDFGGKVAVTLPYVLKTGEKAEDVSVWYLAGDGTMTEIPSTYDPAAQLATFTATRFSSYVVGVAGAFDWANPFSDVSPDNWFYGAVAFVHQKGLFGGTSADTFAPGAGMTRAMLWTVLGRLNGQALSGSGVYEAARTWAMGAGITDGTNPDGSITREQLVTILWRYAGSPQPAGGLGAFADAGSVSDYAAGAMAWAVENGIIEGSGGALMPQDSATGAQVAAIMQRFVGITAQ